MVFRRHDRLIDPMRRIRLVARATVKSARTQPDPQWFPIAIRHNYRPRQAIQRRLREWHHMQCKPDRGGHQQNQTPYHETAVACE